MRAKLPTKIICTLPRPRPNHPSSRVSPHQHRPSNSPSTQTTPRARTLSTTPPLIRQGGANQAPKRATAPSKAHTQAAVDAFDFSDYAATIARVHEQLKADLAKIKAGGRNVEDIEGLRVVLRKGEGDARGDRKGKGKEKEKGHRGESVKLGDVASVVARGRNVGVLVGEKDVRLDSPPATSNSPPSLHHRPKKPKREKKKLTHHPTLSTSPPSSHPSPPSHTPHPPPTPSPSPSPSPP